MGAVLGTIFMVAFFLWGWRTQSLRRLLLRASLTAAGLTLAYAGLILALITSSHGFPNRDGQLWLAELVVRGIAFCVAAAIIGYVIKTVFANATAPPDAGPAPPQPDP
jgi:hypothetical protein